MKGFLEREKKLNINSCLLLTGLQRDKISNKLKIYFGKDVAYLDGKFDKINDFLLKTVVSVFENGQRKFCQENCLIST
jgi:hypothetical protein